MTLSRDGIKNKIEPTVEAFMNNGFTRYESLVLAILTATGTATVKEIHEHTDVPLPKVYQTLDLLLRKKYIKQHSKTRPVKYTAYSTNIIMKRIQEENRRSEKNLESELLRISKLATPSFAGEMYPFTGLEELKRIGRGFIRDTEKQISVAMSANTLSIFAKEFTEAKKRGVKLRSMLLSPLSMFSPSTETQKYKDLGFDHYLIDASSTVQPTGPFLEIVTKFAAILDFIGIMISDMGESIILLPLFPHETYFGIWVYSKQIIEKQLLTYNTLFKIAQKE